MSPRVVAQRYAQALFDLSQRQNNLEEIVTQVEALLNLYRESRLLRNILETPIYTGSRKIAWLRPPFEKTLHPLLWNFLLLLIRRRREFLLNETCEAFLVIYDEQKKRVRATIRTAHPLSPSLKETLAQKLQKALSANEVILTEAVQPALIGGFVLEVGTRVADMSVRGQLHEIEKNLFSN